MSPTLHRLIEHGGGGPAHTHVGDESPQETQFDDPNHPFPHSHVPETFLSQRHAPKRVLAHKHEFDLPKIPVAQLWHLLTHLIDGEPQTSDYPQKPRPHHHDSLSQLMLGGLMEQHLQFESVRHPVFQLASYQLPGDDLVLIKNWDVQTVPRGPPA
jgi:hypothetical protein